jgi:uncharacterized lipoprotein YddW (UPF0748 family)
MKTKLLLFCLWLLSTTALAQTAEVRGVWVARDSFGSRAEIRTLMQQLAAGNFNLALIDVWSRGYPIWRSEVFERETGVAIDPAYADRDVLRECLEEGQAVGIHVMPWAEYGFIGGWSEYFSGPNKRGLIFERHPEWLARNKAGDERFTAPTGFFYWMAQTRPDVQEFVMRLMAEVLEKYPVQGLQFDRLRYPSLECGYDDYTVELYQREHNGLAPPQDHLNAQWVRWRADKMNEFARLLYARLRGRNRLISNAPIVFPFGYVNFAQDYPGWQRDRALDFTVPQIYRRTTAEYVAELERQLAVTPDRQTLVPGVDITNSADPAVLAEMIQATRARHLPGVVVWYARALQNTNAFPYLKSAVYREPAPLPWLMRPSNPVKRRVGTLPGH